MRLLILSVFALVAGSAAASDFTYLSGTVPALTPNSGGKLTYSSGKAIQLRTSDQKVAIPYNDIVRVELGEVHTPAPDPIYKVWSLHKRFSPKGETQEVTVTFKDEAGHEQTATLELAKQDATAVVAAIQDRNEWWGDQVWKTRRNDEQWK
jgi:hypothetical protein